MYRVTTPGLSERFERVLAYLFFWVSGLVLFFIEKNRNVRFHAVQSVITFGTLSLVTFGVSVLKGILGWIPLLGLLTNAGLGLLLNVLWWVAVFLWLWLIAMAWMQPDYRLPFVSRWVNYFI